MGLRIVDTALLAAGVALAAAGLWSFAAYDVIAGGFMAALALLVIVQAALFVRRSREFETRLDDLTYELKRKPRSVAAQQLKIEPKPDLMSAAADVRAALGNPFAATAEPKLEPRTRADRLDLYLEPVIALKTGQSGHYRASGSLETALGQRTAHELLYANAQGNGLRASLDRHLAGRVREALRRIRRKRPDATIFLPVGASTLEGAEDLEALLVELGPPAGIVFEVAQDDLARLTERGLRGLARLARDGATLALCNARQQGCDLKALLNLGFRYLSVNVGPTAAQPMRSWLTYARDQGFELMAAGVTGASEAGRIATWAQLARGPHYAPPRLVKPQAGEALRRAA